MTLFFVSLIVLATAALLAQIYLYLLAELNILELFANASHYLGWIALFLATLIVRLGYITLEPFLHILAGTLFIVSIIFHVVRRRKFKTPS